MAATDLGVAAPATGGPAEPGSAPEHRAAPVGAATSRTALPVRLVRVLDRPWAGLATGAALLVASFPQVDAGATGGSFGLAGALPVTWWLGAGLVTVGFARLVAVAPGRRWWLLAHVVVIVAALHATPGLIEAHARFPTAWTHVGFVDHIGATGRVDPGYDGRYNWPGAFSFGNLLVDLTGAESARALVRFAPVVVNLLLLAPLALIVTHVTRDARVRWVALWLAVVTNWVGQDYLAPQPLALVAYLTVIGVLLRWFRSPGPQRASAVDLLARARRRRPGVVRDGGLAEAVSPAPPASPGQRTALVALVVGVASVVAFSHQLTPFALVVAAGVLVLAGRVDRPLVPVALAVGAVAWVAFGATEYLRSNAADITGGIGDVGGVVGDNQSRVGPDTIRQLVLGTRVGFTALAAAVGAAGLWCQWRARRADWGLVGLAAGPGVLAVLSPYGGEVMLRVSLLCLPFLAVLGAFALLPEGAPPERARRRAFAFAAVVLAALPLFVVARYGNEAYERIEGDDIAAWDHLVEHAPAGAAVVVPDFAGPWRYRDLTRFDYRVLADEVAGDPDAAALDGVVATAAGDGPGYVVVGTASARYREIAEGYPDGWAGAVVDDLVGTGRYTVVFAAGETRVLERRPGGHPEAVDP